MEIEKKYALLDTDFIVRKIIAKKNENDHLIDKLLEFDDYNFVCHEKVLEKISAYSCFGEAEWLTLFCGKFCKMA